MAEVKRFYQVWDFEAWGSGGSSEVLYENLADAKTEAKRLLSELAPDHTWNDDLLHSEGHDPEIFPQPRVVIKSFEINWEVVRVLYSLWKDSTDEYHKNLIRWNQA